MVTVMVMIVVMVMVMIVIMFMVCYGMVWYACMYILDHTCIYLVFGQTHSTGKKNISDICVVVVRLEVLSGKGWPGLVTKRHKGRPYHSESTTIGYYVYR